MGTWGAGPFENDAAMDWVSDLADCDDGTPIANVLKELLECTPDDRESDLCCAAIAAAATVSAEYYRSLSSGIVVTSYDDAGNVVKEDEEPPVEDRVVMPEEVIKYLEREPNFPMNLQAAAVHSVKAIQDNSELRDLWMESEDSFEQWIASLEDMLEWLPRVPDYKIEEAKKWVTPMVTLATGFQPTFKNLEKDTERFLKECKPISRSEYQSYGMKAYEDAFDMLFQVYWDNKAWPPLVKCIKGDFDYRTGHNRYLDELTVRLLEAREFEHLFTIWDKVLKQQSAYYRSCRRDRKKWPDEVPEDRVVASRGWLTLTLSKLMQISRIAKDEQWLEEYREIYSRVDAGKNP